VLKYTLFSPAFEVIARDYRRAKGLNKKTETNELLGGALEQIERYQNPVMLTILANELAWSRSGRKVIFPENKGLVLDLLKSAADVKDPRGLVFPFSSFSIACPEGMEINGTAIKSSLISYMKIREVNETLLKSMYSETKLKNRIALRFTGKDPEERIFYIIQRSSLGRPFSYCFLESDVPGIMAAKDYREGLNAISFRVDKSPDNIPEQEEELKEQFYAVKLACALGIYNQATDSKFLTPGLPEDGPPRQFITGGQWQKNISPSCLQAPPVEKDSPRGHVRSWFFRQLRHEKYYQKEYKTLAPGSRWRFVRSALVGGADPHTLSSDKK
jgi:hypothetical protein